jgi:hypothetical protein
MKIGEALVCLKRLTKKRGWVYVFSENNRRYNLDGIPLEDGEWVMYKDLMQAEKDFEIAERYTFEDI